MVLRDCCTRKWNFSCTTVLHDSFTDSWSESEIEIEMALLKYIAPLRLYANTLPVYVCGFTNLDYPQKLKCENVRSDQFTKVFTLENFLLYGIYPVSSHPPH